MSLIGKIARRIVGLVLASLGGLLVLWVAVATPFVATGMLRGEMANLPWGGFLHLTLLPLMLATGGGLVWLGIIIDRGPKPAPSPNED